MAGAEDSSQRKPCLLMQVLACIAVATEMGPFLQESREKYIVMADQVEINPWMATNLFKGSRIANPELQNNDQRH